MRKITPFIFSVFASFAVLGQTNGGWGNCEFATVTAMNAFDPSGDNFACKKVFVQATDEHYRWDGAAWVLESVGATGNTIYTADDTLSTNRVVEGDGKTLSFTGLTSLSVIANAISHSSQGIIMHDADSNNSGFGEHGFYIGGIKQMAIENTGTLDFLQYGSGTQTGTNAYFLGVDATGNIIEIDPTAISSFANIYTQNGILTNDRTLKLDAHQLLFDMNGIGDFKVLDNGTQAFTVQDNGLVGIGNVIPVAPLHIYEATGTTPSANDGTIVLEHGNSGGESSIVFKSNVNTGDDYAYISYGDDGSGNGFNAENGLLTIGVEDDISTTNKVDDIAIMPSGALGVGTISPDARLDVEGGSVRFSNYGAGTYMDTLATTPTDSSTYVLAVDTQGDVVEMNTAKSSKIFYPPALVIDVSSTGTNLTLDLHQEYVDLFATPAVASSGAPAAIPTYTETELYYYVTDYDTAIFSNISISAAGVLTYDIDTVPTDNCAIFNVVFVVK